MRERHLCFSYTPAPSATECLSGIVSAFLLAVGRDTFTARKKSVMRRVPGASRLVDPLRDDRRFEPTTAHSNEIFLPVLLVALFFFSLVPFPPPRPALMDRNVCRYFRSRRPYRRIIIYMWWKVGFMREPFCGQRGKEISKNLRSDSQKFFGTDYMFYWSLSIVCGTFISSPVILYYLFLKDSITCISVGVCAYV